MKCTCLVSRRATFVFSLLAFTYGCGAPVVEAEDVLILAGDFVCESCGLDLSEVRVLGSEDGPDSFDNTGVMVRSDSNGRYYAANEFGSHDKVYDDHGMAAQLGQRGAGPGEFMAILAIDAEDDGTLHVFDGALGTHTTFGPDLELQSTKLLDILPSHAVMVLPDGASLLIASSVPTPSGVGSPVHVMSDEGKLERSFGSQGSEDHEDTGTSALRLLAASGDTAVWVAHWSRYRLELWDLREAAEAPLLTIERQVSWFPPGLEDSESVALPPAPRVVDLQETADGRIMTVLRVPGEDWEAAVSQNGGHKEITDPQTYFDTILEVLDPGAGEVVVSVRRPEVLGSFAGPGLVTEGALDSDLIPRIKLLQVQFRP